MEYCRYQFYCSLKYNLFFSFRKLRRSVSNATLSPTKKIQDEVGFLGWILNTYAHKTDFKKLIFRYLPRYLFNKSQSIQKKIINEGWSPSLIEREEKSDIFHWFEIRILLSCYPAYTKKVYLKSVTLIKALSPLTQIM